MLRDVSRMSRLRHSRKPSRRRSRGSTPAPSDDHIRSPGMELFSRTVRADLLRGLSPFLVWILIDRVFVEIAILMQHRNPFVALPDCIEVSGERQMRHCNEGAVL